MNKKLLIYLLSLLVLSTTVAMADDTATTTNSRPQPPRFENGTPPDFNSNSGNFTKGQQSQMNGENKQGSQNMGRRPKYKPDSQPGGKMEPKEWGSSSDNGQNGQGFKGGQSQQFNRDNSNNRPPMPPKQNNTNSNNS